MPTAEHKEEYRDTAANRAQVFLCHHGGDCKHTVAGALHFLLNKLGVRTFWDYAHLRHGDNEPQMGLACHQCSCAVVVFSPKFFQSKWTIKELKTFAWHEQQDDAKADEKKLIVPLLLNNTRVDECAEQCQSYFSSLKRRMYAKYDEVDSLASFVCRALVHILHHPSLAAARQELDRIAVQEFNQAASGNRRVLVGLVHDWLMEYCESPSQQHLLGKQKSSLCAVSGE